MDNTADSTPSADREPVEETIEPKETNSAGFMPIIRDESISRSSFNELDRQLTQRQLNQAAAFDEIDHQELRKAVTALTLRRTTSTAHPSGIDTLIGNENPTLDPQSKSFDLGKWLRKFVELYRNEGGSPKHLGLAFKDFTVSGTGSALQLQETVGSLLTSPLRPGEFFSFGKKEPKTILNHFNGLVKSGELLLVLGRPGSGCSTLLKSVTGELHGLHVDEKSVVHYNGIPQKQMMKEFKGETVYNQEVRFTQADGKPSDSC
jgi:ATP-binding cassette, subfamily G (WHITE), member 2, PDR